MNRKLQKAKIEDLEGKTIIKAEILDIGIWLSCYDGTQYNINSDGYDALIIYENKEPTLDEGNEDAD